MSNATGVPYLPAGYPAILTVDPTKRELKPDAIRLLYSTVIR